MCVQHEETKHLQVACSLISRTVRKFQETWTFFYYQCLRMHCASSILQRFCRLQHSLCAIVLMVSGERSGLLRLHGYQSVPKGIFRHNRDTQYAIPDVHHMVKAGWFSLFLRFPEEQSGGIFLSGLHRIPTSGTEAGLQIIRVLVRRSLPYSLNFLTLK